MDSEAAFVIEFNQNQSALLPKNARVYFYTLA
jgi:hypothetical protein